MKTARFADLVKEAGKPQTHLPWSAPKADRALQRALKERRVLTVHQENVGSSKDFGTVGLHEAPNAQFLIFPKSVGTFEGRRVVGINYEWLADAGEFAPAPATPKERRKTAKASARKAVAKRPAGGARSAEDENVVAFARPKEEPKRRTTTSVKAAKGEETAAIDIDPQVLRVVRRAMKDLDAGKAVAAYKRLESLVKGGGEER